MNIHLGLTKTRNHPPFGALYFMAPNLKISIVRKLSNIQKTSVDNMPKHTKLWDGKLFRFGYSVSQNVCNIISNLNKNILDIFYSDNYDTSKSIALNRPTRCSCQNRNICKLKTIEVLNLK